MSTPPPSGSAAVRGIRRSVTEAVAAAAAQQLEPLHAASAAKDPERLAIVQGSVVRTLLEQLHPGGLSSADAQETIQRCARAAAPWYPDLDPNLLVLVLMGALGATDPTDGPQPNHTAISEHAALLIADLLAVADEPLDGYLSFALAEIERAETMEMP